MPGKSRRGKGKHPHYSKKSKIRQRQVGAGLPQPTGAGLPQQAATSVPQPAAPVNARPVSKAAAPSATTATIQYPIVSELKRIGILTGIIIIILVILYIVLT
jgi:hypothetical protein